MSTDEHAGALYYSVIFFQYLSLSLYIYILLQILSIKKTDSKKDKGD